MVGNRGHVARADLRISSNELGFILEDIQCKTQVSNIIERLALEELQKSVSRVNPLD